MIMLSDKMKKILIYLIGVLLFACLAQATTLEQNETDFVDDLAKSINSSDNPLFSSLATGMVNAKASTIAAGERISPSNTKTGVIVLFIIIFVLSILASVIHTHLRNYIDYEQYKYFRQKNRGGRR